MTEGGGPKRHQTDPYLRLDPEDIAFLDECNKPPPRMAEQIVDAFLGPHQRDEDDTLVTMVTCPRCAHVPICTCCNGLRAVTPAVRQAYLDREAEMDESNENLSDLDADDLNDEEPG